MIYCLNSECGISIWHGIFFEIIENEADKLHSYHMKVKIHTEMVLCFMPSLDHMSYFNKILYVSISMSKSILHLIAFTTVTEASYAVCEIFITTFDYCSCIFLCF